MKKYYSGHFNPMHRKTSLANLYITCCLLSGYMFLYVLYGFFFERILKFPAVIVNISIFFFSSFGFCFRYLGILLSGAYIHHHNHSFLVDQKYHHYIIPLFSSSNFLCYEIYLSAISIATTTF